jgi:hypothetical protein
MKKLILLISLTIFVLICSKSFAQTTKINFGIKYQIKSLNYEYVDDVQNHKMGVAQGTGFAYMKDGSYANVSVSFIFDYIDGAGSFIENYVILFSDSSKISIKAEGNSFGNETDPLFSAKVTIMYGTGIYEGIKGSGKMSGNRRSQLDDKATVNLSFDLEYKLKN